MNEEKLIHAHFERFLESRKKYSQVILKRKKLKIALEYECYYIDEWDSTGWILYKGFLKKCPTLYMFKGKPYEPKKFAKVKGGLKLWKRTKRQIGIVLDRPDWAMRHKAEKQVAKRVVAFCLSIGLVGGLMVAPIYLSKQKAKAEAAALNAQVEQDNQTQEGQVVTEGEALVQDVGATEDKAATQDKTPTEDAVGKEDSAPAE